MRVGALLRMSALAILLSVCHSVWSLSLARTITEFQHTAFGPRVGGPSDVHCFAQAADGTLWLGTGAGIFRFDGSAFEAVTTLDGQNVGNRTVVSLFMDRHGGLWFGYGGIGSGYLSPQGKYRKLDASDGWNTIESVAEAPDGVLWMVNGDRLVRVVDGRKQPVGHDWGLPDGMVYETRVDADGTIWVAMNTDLGVFYLPRGDRQFRHVDLDFHTTMVIPGPHGTIWGSSKMSGLRVLKLRDGMPDRVYKIAPVRADFIHFDKHADLWFSNDKGVFHVSDPLRLLTEGQGSRVLEENFGKSQGLSANAMWNFFSDEEGDVWVGSTGGMDKFRETPFRPLPLPLPGHGFGVIPGVRGGVLAVNWDGHPLLVQGRTVRATTGVGASPFSLVNVGSGGVWVGGGLGLQHATDGEHFSNVDIPATVTQRIVRTMAQDPQGRLWIGTVRPSPAGYLKDGIWQSPVSIAGLPPDTAPVRLFANSAGQVWLATRSALYLVDGDSARQLVPDVNSIGLGLVSAFAENAGRTWITGTEGVVMFDGSRFRSLTGRDGHPYRYFSGIVARKNGDLWMRGPGEVVRISGSELARWQADPAYHPWSERFDATDGLIGSVPTSGVKPTLAEASDGTLWFSSDEGLSTIDPDALPPAPSTLQPTIRGLVADARVVDGSTSIEVPANTRQLEIRYAAAALSTPERLRYRYRLDGLDSDWQEAGVRRVAFYTSLAPGHYRFRVAASLQPGKWEGPERVMEFRVLPAWYQTVWFKVLVALLALGMLAFLHWLRVRWVAAKVGLQERAKLGERMRVARELHDTVLQGTQVLVLQVANLANKIEPSHPLREQINDALEKCTQALRDGRDRVLNLRGSTSGRRSLATVIAERAAEIPRAGTENLDVQVHGTERALQEGIAEEICRLITEALRNAFQHAHAANVLVSLHFDAEVLRVVVKDDGVGMAGTHGQYGRPGHWGIAGMQERASGLLGRLTIRSEPGCGTEIEVEMPSRRAYLAAREPRHYAFGAQP